MNTEELTKAIVTAADEGRLEDVKSALAAGASPDAMGPNSGALHCAAFKGHKAIVKLLLEAGANPNIADKQEYFPIHLAAAKGNNAEIELLLQHGSLLEHKTSYGGTVMHIAAASDYPETVKLLAKLGADIEAKDQQGNTPLATACGLGRAKVAKTLVTAGAKLLALNDDLETMLHKLARGIKTVRLKQWQTSGEVNGRPRSYQIRNGHFTMTDGDHTKTLPVKEQYQCARLDWGPSSHLAYLEACDLFVQFLKSDIDVHAVDKFGNHALSLIAHAGEGRLVKTLLKAKLDVSLANGSMATPLHLAAGSGRPDGLEELIKSIPEAQLSSLINLGDNFGWTPLHYLADIGGTAEMAMLLISHGADRMARSTQNRGGDMPEGMRPTDVAMHWRDKEMAALLI